jgi:hypothetical protein
MRKVIAGFVKERVFMIIPSYVFALIGKVTDWGTVGLLFLRRGRSGWKLMATLPSSCTKKSERGF